MRKAAKVPKNPNHPFLKYSGLAFQLLAPIVGFALLGRYLDEHYQRDFPLWTLLLSLFGVVSGLYLGLKDFIK